MDKRTFIAFLSLFVANVGSLATFKIATLVLPKAEVGVIALATSIIGIIAILDSTLQASLANYFIENAWTEDEKLAAIRSCAKLVMIANAIVWLLGVAAFLGVLLINWQRDAALFRTTLIVLALLCLGQLTGAVIRPISSFMFSRDRQYEFQICQICATAVQFLIYIAGLWYYHSVVAFAVATIAGQIVLTVILWKRTGSTFAIGKVWDAPIERSQVSAIWRISAPLFLLSVAVQISFGVQNVIVTRYLGLTTVAMFLANQKLPQVLLQLAWRYFDADAPRMQTEVYGMHMEHSGGASRFSRRYARNVLLGLLAVTGIIVLQNLFVRLTANVSYCLPLHYRFLFGAYLLSHLFAHNLGFVLNAAAKRRVLAQLAITSSVVELGLCWLLVAFGHLEGVLISAIIGNFFVFWINSRRYAIQCMELPLVRRSNLALFAAIFVLLVVGCVSSFA